MFFAAATLAATSASPGASDAHHREDQRAGLRAGPEAAPLLYEQFVALRDNIAVNGVLVPILVTEDKQIIDGNYRKAIADELGYDCPEIVQNGLTEEEKRTLARALNLARRQLTQEQQRQLIADQLREPPERANPLGRQAACGPLRYGRQRAQRAITTYSLTMTAFLPEGCKYNQMDPFRNVYL